MAESGCGVCWVVCKWKFKATELGESLPFFTFYVSFGCQD